MSKILSDEEIDSIEKDCWENLNTDNCVSFARAIEQAVMAKLREQNVTHKQALDDLGVTPAEAKAGVASLASLLLEESLFFVCGEDDTLATKIEQFLSKHKIQGETKSCV